MGEEKGGPDRSMRAAFRTATDYELAALYCDYHEWLNSPATGPRGPDEARVRAKYEGYLQQIMGELGRRHAPYPPQDGSTELMREGRGDPAPRIE